MRDLCTYHIKLKGQVRGEEINAMSPIDIIVEQAEMDETLVTFCADQTGLVGLVSYLHGLGFVFLSITRMENQAE